MGEPPCDPVNIKRGEEDDNLSVEDDSDTNMGAKDGTAVEVNYQKEGAKDGTIVEVNYQKEGKLCGWSFVIYIIISTCIAFAAYRLGIYNGKQNVFVEDIKEYSKRSKMDFNEDQNKNHFQVNEEQNENNFHDEFRMILFGDSGAGKSATGNTILGKDIFLSKPWGQSSTKKVEFGIAERFNYRLIVVDTPDFVENTDINITPEILKCYALTSPGLHAFILVLKIDRTYDNINRSLLDFLKYFDQDAIQYVFVIFTFKSKLENENMPLEEFISTLPYSVKHILEKINGRYVAFGYKRNITERNLEVKNFINKVAKNLRSKEGMFYQNSNYNIIEQILLKKESQIAKDENSNWTDSKKNIRDVLRKRIQDGLFLEELPKIKEGDVGQIFEPGYFDKIREFFGV